jgi:type VI secretion system protein VasG
LSDDEARYEAERAIVAEITELRETLDRARHASEDGEPVDVPATREKLAERVAALHALQGGEPMVPLQVDGTSWPRSSPPGRAFRSARWSRTRSTPC